MKLKKAHQASGRQRQVVVVGRNACEFFGQCVLCYGCVIVHLQAALETFAGTEKAQQAQGCANRHGAFSRKNR